MTTKPAQLSADVGNLKSHIIKWQLFESQALDFSLSN